jgi:hypothetical protein
MASPPRVRAFLFCDGVVKDPLTRKSTVVGVFEVLLVRSVPAEPQPFTVYAAFAGLNGRYSFEVEIVADDLQTVMRRHVVVDEFEADDPLVVNELIVDLDDISWPSTGRYTVRLRYNGHLLEDASLSVETAG